MNLIKTIIALLLITTCTSAVTFVANTNNDTMILSSKTYTAKLNIQENLLGINNILEIYQYPKVEILGITVEPVEPSIGGITIGESVNEYLVDYPQAVKKDVYVSSRITFFEDYIHQEIKIENTHSSEMEINIKLIPKTNKSSYIYTPYNTNPSANYLWISPPFHQERGLGLAVYFDTLMTSYVQPGETMLAKNTELIGDWSITINSGEIKTISLRYITGYASDRKLIEQHAFSPPATKQHLLDVETDSLFEIKNTESLKQIRSEISAGSAAELVTKVKERLDLIPDTPTSETTNQKTIYDMKELLEKSQLNSLEKALLFREIIRKKGVPAEIIIGLKENTYYAWVYAYPTVEPVFFDPAGKLEAYEKIYEEPTPKYCSNTINSCNWASDIGTDRMCILNFCASTYLFITFILIALITVFLFLQYKADFLYKIAGRAKMKKTDDEKIHSYHIIKRDYVPINPLEETVLKKLKERMGIVELARYEKETGFSRLLIETTIEELENREIIKKM
ncbi:hypothetical protein K8R43_04950 [archaeon]|nr:hypothetical protein [archaeon]